VTSQINYAAINEDFPVPGQDNDTQVFRDNFDTIKQNFRYAQEEITDLQSNVIRADVDNDFNNKIISNAVLQDTREALLDGGAYSNDLTIDFGNGTYQIFRIGANINLSFSGFPDENSNPQGVGRVTLELYGDGIARTITLTPGAGASIKKLSLDQSVSLAANSFSVTSNTNPIFIEIWKYNSFTTFVKYIGQFS
jgi:hypothetical protein